MVSNFKDLLEQTLYSFDSIQLTFVPMKDILYSESFLKKGEGPINYSWNDREIVITNDRL